MRQAAAATCAEYHERNNTTIRLPPFASFPFPFPSVLILSTSSYFSSSPQRRKATVRKRKMRICDLSPTNVFSIQRRQIILRALYIFIVIHQDLYKNNDTKENKEIKQERQMLRIVADLTTAQMYVATLPCEIFGAFSSHSG